jgi:hypothetical protein
VQLKPEIGQNLPGQLLGATGLRLASAHHDKIVRPANEPAMSTISERPVQRVQVDVRQKRRDHTALRGPSERTPQHPLLHHTRLQPLPYQLEHPPIRDPLGDLDKQQLVVDRGEVVADVGLENEAVPVDERTTQHLLRLRCRTTRAESIRGLQKASLENGLKHDPHGLLDNPIPNGRDPQRPHTTPGLGNLNPPDRPRAIAPLAKIPLQLGKQPLCPVILNRRQGLSIDPGSTLVPLHAPPRLPQDVTPEDPVKQGVKTPTRRPLGGHP